MAVSPCFPPELKKCYENQKKYYAKEREIEIMQLGTKCISWLFVASLDYQQPATRNQQLNYSPAHPSQAASENYYAVRFDTRILHNLYQIVVGGNDRRFSSPGLAW